MQLKSSLLYSVALALTASGAAIRQEVSVTVDQTTEVSGQAVTKTADPVLKTVDTTSIDTVTASPSGEDCDIKYNYVTVTAGSDSSPSAAATNAVEEDSSSSSPASSSPSSSLASSPSSLANSTVSATNGLNSTSSASPSSSSDAVFAAVNTTSVAPVSQPSSSMATISLSSSVANGSSSVITSSAVTSGLNSSSVLTSGMVSTSGSVPGQVSMAVTSSQQSTAGSSSSSAAEATTSKAAQNPAASSAAVTLPAYTSGGSVPPLVKPVARSVEPTAAAGYGLNYYDDGSILDAIDTSSPSDVFPRKAVPGMNVAENVDKSSPIQTNKFYANMLLEDQHLAAYTQPYGVWWSNLTDYPGMAVTHTDFDQRVYGPDSGADPVEYYINPVGLMSTVFSAKEFSFDDLSLHVSKMGPLSVDSTLKSSSAGSINFPLALGMGLVTAEYDDGLTPVIYSQQGFVDFAQSNSSDGLQKRDGLESGVVKYTTNLNNNNDTWVIYVSSSGGDPVTLEKTDANTLTAKGTTSSNTVIQIGILPSDAESDMDSTAGMYPSSASLSAGVSNSLGVYSIDYDTKGKSSSGTTWIWALPHHLESITSDLLDKVTSGTVVTQTKGIMTGIKTNSLKMSELLYTDLQWLPWSSDSSFSGPSWSDDALDKIAAAAADDLSQDMKTQINVASTYTAGKAFDKFAYVLLVASDILKKNDTTKDALDKLTDVFKIFTENSQALPLMYDTTCGGITSQAAQEGDSGQDYGNPFYNDHHFHYGYYVHTAAVLGYVDKKLGGTWAQDNKDWVNTLVRDVANPSSDDTNFPQFRMYDWYHGHSWAAGMFVSSAGKNEESSSEDYNFAYGMKLWGQVIGDKQMEARGDLMLSVTKRSMGDYFYMMDNNGNQPQNFIKNKVPGITFENQVDHTTFFGTNVEYIQGIHMIPITPVSSLMRTPDFAKQEWEEKLSDIVDSLDSGWAGILRSNQAIFDAKSSYDWFSQDNFDKTKLLDGGASLTWYLAYSAGLMGQ